jgi:hypothetical protein
MKQFRIANDELNRDGLRFVRSDRLPGHALKTESFGGSSWLVVAQLATLNSRFRNPQLCYDRAMRA